MSEKKFEAHWLDQVIEDLDRREDAKLVLSTAKTPSGSIHVGVGRELIYCSALERLLQLRGRETEFLFFIDDFDSLKSFPSNIPEEFRGHQEYVGMPFYRIPCPYGHCESWAKHFADEMIQTFPSFGLNPKIIWTHHVYESEQMKNLIRTALKQVEVLREIMNDILAPTLRGEKYELFKTSMEKWYPCLVVCKRCGRLKTTQVTSYHAATDVLNYTCSECGFSGEAKLGEWPVKLRWRIDWPAKWALFKVSCEPAGKDHSVKGGAYDTGEEIARRVFDYRGPQRISYEWILLGEHAMKTHKGISFTFAEWLAVAPPEIYRYMILREPPRRHISFAPERLPQLIDEFERAERIYYEIDPPANREEGEALKRIYPLSLPSDVSEHIPVRLPYRFAVILSQLTTLLGWDKVLEKSNRVLEKIYGKNRIGAKEAASARDRLQKAGYWIEHYAPEDVKFKITSSLPVEVKEALITEQKEGLKILSDMLRSDWDEKSLQYEIFELGKRLNIGGKIFQAVYLIFLGRRFGPRLAPFLLSLDRTFVLSRLDEAIKN